MAFQALNIAKKMMSSSAFSNASALTADALNDLGPTLSGFPPSFTSGLSADAIVGAMDNLKECEFPRGQVSLQCQVDKTCAPFKSALSSVSVVQLLIFQAKQLLQTMRESGNFEVILPILWHFYSVFHLSQAFWNVDWFCRISDIHVHSLDWSLWGSIDNFCLLPPWPSHFH